MGMCFFGCSSEPRLLGLPAANGALRRAARALLAQLRFFRAPERQARLLTACIAVLALAIWIAPQEWLGQPRRMEGGIAIIWWLPTKIQDWLGQPGRIVGF